MSTQSSRQETQISSAAAMAANAVVSEKYPNPQQPSGMPIHKYLPFHEQIKVELPDRTWPTKRITQAPRWCAVDLRDGNQALIEPMDVERKQIGRASCRERE